MSRLAPTERAQALISYADGKLVNSERVLARFQSDLNADLNFHQGMIVLTSQRLMYVESGKGDAIQMKAWKIGEIDDLVLEEFGATASIHLMQGERAISTWRTTGGRVREADSLLTKFKAQRNVVLAILPEDPPTRLDESDVDGAESEVVAPPRKAMVRLWKFVRPWRKQMALAMVLTLASTAASMIWPGLTIPLVDKVLIPLHDGGKGVAPNLVYYYIAALAGAAILAWALTWAKTYILARVSERVASQLRRQTFNHIQELSLTYFNKKRTGDLISRISSDTDEICYFMSVNLIGFVDDILMILFTAVILFTMNPVMALCALAPLPIVAWLVQRVRELLRGGFAAGSRAWSQMTSVLADTIPGVRVVKAFAQERREIERFRAADQQVLDANDRVNKTWSFFEPMIVLLSDTGLLVVWGVGAWSVAHDHLSVGMLTGFIAYIGRFYGRLDSMSRMLAAVQRAAASAHRVFDVLDVKPDMPVTVNTKPVGHLQGEIEFRNVKFRYGARQIIRGVNLKIAAGEMIGLVGPSGSGKTTLVNLVCRFFEVSEGAILVDGADLRELNVEDYRKNLGLVLQEPYLFYGTIMENIAYGKQNATRAEIIGAARAARAHEFIMRLQDGYDSMVGERGQQLSGGERQRISIARALLINPAILILDEATSSVDTETEREIQAALENLITGRTTIAIAHRLGTLRRANRLVVMEDGRISEIGSHEQLMKTSGTYSRLHQAMLEVTNG